MTELIKITERDGQKAVSARELHEFLEVNSKFADWIKNRINEYDFIEGQDFVSVSKNLENGGRSIEYALTLDMAKELSMVEKTERGKQARRYFIEMEKQAKGMLLINKNQTLQVELFNLIRINLLKGDISAVAEEYGFNKNRVKSVLYYNTYNREIVKALYNRALSNKNQLHSELEEMINKLKS